ncbi:hypothetical protein Taro_056748, partial [Colocasia esculenta]|nr:hypothetical protein [Colocasia esculenta]
LVAGKVVVHVADAFICIWIRLKKGHLIIIVVIVANRDIIEVHVQGHNPLITKMEQFAGPVDTSVLYAQSSHRSQLVHAGQDLRWNVRRAEINNPHHVLRLYRLEFDHQEDYQMWHHRADYIIPPDEETVGIGRGEYMAWYWSITRRYIARPGFSYDMHYEPQDHIERSLVDGPSESCAGTPQEPDDAGPSHFSPDVMTVSQYGLYNVGASQILTDEGMIDTQPPQSTTRPVLKDKGEKLIQLICLIPCKISPEDGHPSSS